MFLKFMELYVYFIVVESVKRYNKLFIFEGDK